MSTIALKNPDLKSYSSLLSAVRKTIESGKRRALYTVEREQARAAYGKQVILRLSKDIQITTDELYRMVEFARAYPIFAPARKLTWALYRELLAVNDPEKRKAIEVEASKNNWKRDRLRLEIKKLRGNSGDTILCATKTV